MKCKVLLFDALSSRRFPVELGLSQREWSREEGRSDPETYPVNVFMFF